MSDATSLDNSEAVRQKVRAGYSQIAKSGGSCCGTTPTCCGSSPVASADLAKHIGYTAEELTALPEGANMGLSCGNPNALAALQPGEVVLDLGAGGGFDVFIAGKKVGATGRAMGVDMTAEMLGKARKNIAAYRERTGLDNVEFRLGEIEHLPLADNSVDAIAAIAESVEALVGCVAGAVLVAETERMAKEAGLVDVVTKSKAAYIDGMVDWQDPLYRKIIANLPAETKPSDYVTSLEISVRKRSLNLGSNVAPRGGACCGPAVETQKTS
ncbi:MAG: methyltransferase domain-containing protein [Verrucomicrobia bacterium]|nr:methyltransferase domain-containing protein [Verrucomicrobiota bacterium]